MAFDLSSGQRFSFAAPHSIFIKWFSFTAHASKSCNWHLSVVHFLPDMLYLFWIFVLDLWLCVESLIWIVRLLISWFILDLILFHDYVIVNKNVDLFARWKYAGKLSWLWWIRTRQIGCKFPMRTRVVWGSMVHNLFREILALKNSFVPDL